MNRKQARRLYRLDTVTDPDTGRERKVSRYIGKYSRLSVSAAQYKRRLLAAALLWAATIGLFVFCALQNNAGTRCFYVLPFFLFEMFPLFYEGMGLWRMARLKDRLTEGDRLDGFDRAEHSALGVAVLAGLTIVGELVLLLVGVPNMIGELAFLCGQTALAACAFFGWRAVRAFGGWIVEVE